MSTLTKIIDSALRGHNNFCCLCLNFDQTPNFNNINDVIDIKIDNTEYYLTIQDLFDSLLAPEINQYLSENENICSKCVESATSSYTFIQSSKSNMFLLTKAIEALSHSAENATNELTSKQTKLYLSLHTQNLTSKHIFNSKTKPNKRGLILNKQVVPTIKGHSQNLFLKREIITKQYECSQCPLIFLKKQFLKQHERESHTKYPCSLCDKILTTSQSLKRHEAYHTSSVVCQYCGRSYKTKHSYDKHFELNICKAETRANPSNAKFTCNYCNKKYTQKVSLRVHIQFEHGNYKAHICEWCGKKFWAQSRLKAHIVKHTKERNFVCSICSGKFVTKEALLYHTRLHTGEKPYKCTECNSRFLSASRRSVHMKRCHDGTCLQCDTCPSRFNSRLYLERHKQVCQKMTSLESQAFNSQNQGDISIRNVKNKINMKNEEEMDKIPITKLEEISGVDEVHNMIYQMDNDNSYAYEITYCE